MQRLREERGLLQKEIASASGLRQTLVSKMELGESLTMDNLSALARAYCMTLSRFFAMIGE